MEPDTAAFDLYTAYRMSEFAYDLLERYGHQAIGGYKAGDGDKGSGVCHLHQHCSHWHYL